MSGTSTLPPVHNIPNDLSDRELLARLKAEYDHADEFCRRVQHYRDQAGIPAMNELRYAGYHLRHALDAEGKAANPDQLRRAISHCQRAIYEAAEAGMLLALREINLFKKDYEKVLVTGTVPSYVEILAASARAQRFLGKARKLGDDQSLDHKTHSKLFNQLSEASNLLDAARPEINKKMVDDRTVQRRWIVGLIVGGVVTLIAATIGIFREKLLSVLGMI